MTAESARAVKEARAILYPWVGVSLLCALPLVSGLSGSQTVYALLGPTSFVNLLFQMGVFIGIPLLACLSYGNEFRHRTLDLLLSQPVNRLRIWREKWFVTAAAVLIPTLIAAISSRPQYSFVPLVTADFFIFLIVITCSAPFWTLVGRSTLGGFVLNIAAIILLMSMKSGLDIWNAHSPFIDKSIEIAAVWATTLVYSGFMLWLGRWMLVHRQSNGGFVGADVMEAIPRVLPAPVASLFRCRPNQVILNLFRKDVRLLRPLWLLMALYVVSWIVMSISASFVPAEEGRQRALLISFVGLYATYTIIAILLAASLAFGEERNFGVQLWHLALPLSMRTQWLVRLVSAMIAAVLCTIAVPAILFALTREVLHPAFMEKLELPSFLEFISPLIIFFIIAFWCAVVARDLIRTAGLLVAAGGMAFVAIQGSTWITEQLIWMSIQLRWFVITRFQLEPTAFENPLGWSPDVSRYFLWILTAFCVAMVVHTYPLFRRLPQESASRLLRPLAPYLAVIALLISLTAFQNWHYWGDTWKLFFDTEAAIVELPPDRPYTVADLAVASPLPKPTQRWLRNSSMTLAVSDFHPSDQQKLYTAMNSWKKIGRLTIQFQSGMTCNATFLFSYDKSPKLVGGSGTCK